VFTSRTRKTMGRHGEAAGDVYLQWRAGLGFDPAATARLAASRGDGRRRGAPGAAAATDNEYSC
jgi:hypothetical protein